MSTRCHIIVEDPRYGESTILYRHSDGYPDGRHGVLATLVPFVARFMEHRGFDACYMGAQIICDQINKSRESMRAYHERRIREAKDAGREPDSWDVDGVAKVDTDFLGFGISNQIHGDVEYIYRVTPEGIHVEDANGHRHTDDAEAKAMLAGEIPERYREEE